MKTDLRGNISVSCLLFCGVGLLFCAASSAQGTVNVKEIGSCANHGAHVCCTYKSEEIPVPVSEEKSYLVFWVEKNDSNRIPIGIGTVIFNDKQPGVNEGRTFDGTQHTDDHEMFVYPGGPDRYLGYNTNVELTKWTKWISQNDADVLLAGPVEPSDEIRFAKIEVNGNGDGRPGDKTNLRFGFTNQEFEFRYLWVSAQSINAFLEDPPSYLAENMDGS